MKVFKALLNSMKRKDIAPMERYEINKVESTIENLCNKYLVSTDDMLKFEAMPSALDAVISVLESPRFTEKYEFMQEDETCFIVKYKELGIL